MIYNTAHFVATVGLAFLTVFSNSFSTFPSISSVRQSNPTFILQSTTSNYFMDEVTNDPSPTMNSMSVTSPDVKILTRKNEMKKKVVRAKQGNKGSHKDGVFSPIVYAAKNTLGEDKLNIIRARIISYHSDIIKSFVDTYETPFGQTALVRLFALMDKNRDGTLDKIELAGAFRALGFSWLKEKQVEGILNRADVDKNGVIDFEEFAKEAPRTLRTNLVKLAKKNGGEMGLLV